MKITVPKQNFNRVLWCKHCWCMNTHTVFFLNKGNKLCTFWRSCKKCNRGEYSTIDECDFFHLVLNDYWI